MSTRIWKLNNLERYGQLRKILLLPCREFHPPESWMKWEIFSGLIVCSMLDLWRYQVHWPDKIHCRPSKVITVFVWVSRLENPPSTLFSSSIEFSTMELILLYSASIAMSQCTVLMHLCVHKVYSTHCPPLWLKPRGFVNLLKRQKISRKLQMAGKTETEDVSNLWAQ